jgi:hypothetical protein
MMTTWQEALQEHFKGAFTTKELVQGATKILDGEYEFTAENTVFGTSTCVDEVNRSMERALAEHYGEEFVIGGLAGYPFRGVTGIGAYSHHTGSKLFIFYGPHIGISKNGELGKLDRQGMHHETTACGSAIGAFTALSQPGFVLPDVNPDDYEQQSIMRKLQPEVNKINDTLHPMRKLVMCSYGVIETGLDRILKKALVDFPGDVALLGGIQINTPEGEDQFLVQRFELLNYSTGVKTDLKEKLYHDRR